jgi:lipopolysaccharide transport system ATP-binding protein
MSARLGFSTAIHVDPEILVLDEVLAVGDSAFQAKCVRRVGEMAASGATLLVVSHQIGLIQTMCRRALWLEHGRLKLDAAVEEVAAAYEPPSAAGAVQPEVGFATPHSGR